MEVIQRHPEVRSIAVAIDYHGLLNEAQVNKGLWLGENGAVTTPEAIFGSFFVTLNLLTVQFQRMAELGAQLKKQAEELAKKTLAESQEYARLKQELEQLNQAIAEQTGPTGPA